MHEQRSGERAPRCPIPDVCDGRVAFLLDALDPIDAKLLHEFARAEIPAGNGARVLMHSLSRKPGALAELGETLAGSQALWLQPLRVAWMPPQRLAGKTRVRDLLLSLLSRPGRLRKRWIARQHPERVRVVVAQGAMLTELRERFHSSGESDAAPDVYAKYVRRQALLALDRAERLTRGARYKIPRLLPGDVFANPVFREHLTVLAQQRGVDTDAVATEAETNLREMAAMQTPLSLDIMMALYRLMLRSHHEHEIDVRQDQLDDITSLMSSRPVAFVISHKSMLDTPALCAVLFDNDLPLPLTFGGINLNTPGIGALARRAGVIFLRRSFQDDHVYKATFRRYIDYLIEKRFSLLWALEGTRSRTGKLLPPRFGLFNYVVESILRTGSHDVRFVPVSVAYDQITEVEDYAREQRGDQKRPETATWLLRFLRPGDPHGRIFLRFGESIGLKDLVPGQALNASLDDAQKQSLVQKLALQAAVKMNAATPITATAVLTLILLAGGTRKQTLAEIQFLARSGAQLIRKRKLEIVGSTDFRDPQSVRAMLAQLQKTGIVDFFEAGTEPLYGIRPDAHLNAAYYRNTAIHYFIIDGFVEIALLDAAHSLDADREEIFFLRAEALRELFIFEFYFPSRANYRSEVGARCNDRFRHWREALEKGPNAVEKILGRARPLVAHGTLRSFADAYRVVARALVELAGEEIDDADDFIRACLRIGRQLHLRDRLYSAESVSRSLYQTGLNLARHRRLTSGDENATAGRHSLLAELTTLDKRLDRILQLTLAQANSDGIGGDVPQAE